jgi:hypothetical protein
MNRPASYRAPPRTHAASGQLRRVGVEIEFTGITEHDVAGMVRDLYGGRLIQCDDHRFKVEGTDLGDFVVELDAVALHPRKDGDEESGFLDKLEEAARSALGDVARTVLPCEIAAPPIPWPRLKELDGLIETLRGHGAEGTRQSPAYAFGLQLNPEVAETTVDYLLPMLRAYLLLSDWLHEVIRVDTTRRLFVFAQRFPTRYVERVLDPEYDPSIEQLIDDYLRENASRNRELDLLPLFAHIDEARVERVAADIKIRARPTFHYRLPNCDLEDPDWGLAVEWNRWIAVEELAADQPRLAKMMAEWADHRPEGFVRWAEACARWLGVSWTSR